MEKNLAGAVRRGFAVGLAAAWPESEPATDGLPPSARGCRLFRWQADPGVWFFLFLDVLARDNEFTVEFFWNTEEAFPFDHLPGSGIDETGASPSGRCQLMVPLGQGARNRVWKVGPNPAFAPEVVVPAAIREVQTFAAPIIRAVLDRYGEADRACGNRTG